VSLRKKVREEQLTQISLIELHIDVRGDNGSRGGKREYERTRNDETEGHLQQNEGGPKLNTLMYPTMERESANR